MWTDIAQADTGILELGAKADSASPLGTWAIIRLDSGIPAGAVNLTQLPDDTEVHIGWYLHPDSAGHGYATEAAQAVLDHGLANWVPQVWAIMWEDNAPSACVAAAIGMTSLGVVDDPWFGTKEAPTSLMFHIDNPF